MKYLAPLLFLIVSFIVYSSQLNNQHFDVISGFNDSITNIIEEKEFLYYTKGHHGHIWSLVVSEKDRYILISGNSRNNDCRFDTISINKSVLKWGVAS